MLNKGNLEAHTKHESPLQEFLEGAEMLQSVNQLQIQPALLLKCVNELKQLQEKQAHTKLFTQTKEEDIK